MNKRNYNVYQSIEQKTFRSALFQFVKKEYEFMMGNLALERFCQDVEGLVEKYYPKRDHLKPGQMIWYAVVEDEKPSYAKRITDTRLVPVVLTIVSEEDIEEMKKGTKWSEIKKRVSIRLHNETKDQRGVLSEFDTSAILKISPSNISKYILQYEKETGNIVPRRGTVHDMGRSVSHKRIICYKRFAHKHSSMKVARETAHSLEEVEKYIFDYRRVKYCLMKGIDEDQISFVLKMSNSLVKEYVEIINDIGGKKSEKDLENDLIDYKITIDPEANSLINDSDLRDFEMPDGGRNSRV